MGCTNSGVGEATRLLDVVCGEGFTPTRIVEFGCAAGCCGCDVGEGAVNDMTL